MDEEVENLDDCGCPKVEDLVDEKMWTCSSYPFRHMTTFRSAERRANLFGNWRMHPIIFENRNCELYCQYLRLYIFHNGSIFFQDSISSN